MKKILYTLPILSLSIICYSQKSAVNSTFREGMNIKADIVFENKYGAAFTMDCIQPRQTNGASVIFINSGGFESGKIRFIEPDGNNKFRYLPKDELKILPDGFKYPPLAQYSFDELLGFGFTVFDVRTGSNPTFRIDEIVGNCKTALGFIKKNAVFFGIDSNRIGVFGASSGGYLASYLAESGLGIRSAVVYYPTGYDLPAMKSDFPDVFNSFECLKIDTLILGSLSLKNQKAEGLSAMLIIYGKEDFPFITRDSELLFMDIRSRGIKSEVITFPDTGHEFRGKDGYNQAYGETARLKMVEWFRNTLR